MSALSPSAHIDTQHEDHIHDCQWDYYARRLATASSDRTVKVWNVEAEIFQTIGVSHGGAVVTACRDQYRKAVVALIRLASLQTTFRTLDEEIKMTGRRVNALEYVIIPRIEDIMKYIEQEMDEQAREEFFRVKKVVEKIGRASCRERV